MTYEMLDDYFRLRQDIRNGEAKIEELRMRATSLGSGDMDGMPHNPNVSDKVGNMVATIRDAERELDALRSVADNAGKFVEEWIVETTTDVYIRLILRNRYHHALSWREIAELYGGGRSNANNICKLAMKYVPARGENL